MHLPNLLTPHLPLRLIFNVLPAVLIIGSFVYVVWGDNGVLVRHQLSQQLDQAQDDLARLDGENRRLLRDMRAMHEDPVVVERLVADELGWGRDGDVIVRFDD